MPSIIKSMLACLSRPALLPATLSHHRRSPSSREPIGNATACIPPPPLLSSSSSSSSLQQFTLRLFLGPPTFTTTNILFILSLYSTFPSQPYLWVEGGKTEPGKMDCETMWRKKGNRWLHVRVGASCNCIQEVKRKVEYPWRSWDQQTDRLTGHRHGTPCGLAKELGFYTYTKWWNRP